MKNLLISAIVLTGVITSPLSAAASYLSDIDSLTMLATWRVSEFYGSLTTSEREAFNKANIPVTKSHLSRSNLAKTDTISEARDYCEGSLKLYHYWRERRDYYNNRKQEVFSRESYSTRYYKLIKNHNITSKLFRVFDEITDDCWDNNMM